MSISRIDGAAQRRSSFVHDKRQASATGTSTSTTSTTATTKEIATAAVSKRGPQKRVTGSSVLSLVKDNVDNTFSRRCRPIIMWTFAAVASGSCLALSCRARRLEFRGAARCSTLVFRRSAHLRVGSRLLNQWEFMTTRNFRKQKSFFIRF